MGVDRSTRQVLTGIGERHGASWDQVAIRWLIQQEQIAAVTRSRDVGHREQNLAVFDVELDAEEMARISALHSLA